MAEYKTLEIPVKGMDCADCTRHVQSAIAGLPGVQSVSVLLASEKAIVALDPKKVTLEQIRSAVAGAGYSVPVGEVKAGGERSLIGFTNAVFTLFGIVFGAVLFILVAGEWLGLFEALTSRVPWFVGLLVVLLGGYPVFLNVIRATLKRQIIAHTLMTMGVIAALAVGQWVTAAVVVFFMRIGDFTERYTTNRARGALKSLVSLAPKTARVERNGVEVDVLVEDVGHGETVIVRPGDLIPVDGEVIAGHATIDQSAITGESMPVEAGTGAKVYAATTARLGSLRIRATHAGADTTFGKVIHLVEEAELHRADVQRIADRFSSYFLPFVAGIAALTFIIRRDPLATAAVLVVACSCSFALATPIAMLASIGAGAKRGLMIKGGKYLEVLAKADVLLIDKTGTITLGKPQIVDFRLPGELAGGPVGSAAGVQALQRDVLYLAATAERYSEHPLAEAVRAAAHKEGIVLGNPEQFEAIPGLGLRAIVDGKQVAVGNPRMFPGLSALPQLQGQAGQTQLVVEIDGELGGIFQAADTLREEVPQAIGELRKLGLRKIELLTGDNASTAQALATLLGVDCRAELLPEHKIGIVRAYQAQGHTVVMVGDGVNDAPALAAADVGIAMGAAGSDIAVEAAHLALLRDDWLLVPEAVRIARRTLRVVKGNITFTMLFNLIGLSLAAFGFIPPIVAAALQSIPDIGILANSSRLIKQPVGEKYRKPAGD